MAILSRDPLLYRNIQTECYLQCELLIVRRRVILGLGSRFGHREIRVLITGHEVYFNIRITIAFVVQREPYTFSGNYLNFQIIVPNATSHGEYSPVRFVKMCLGIHAS